MFATIEGIKIFYEKCDGSGAPIVLMHGWGGSHISFKGLYDALKSSGRTVLNFDFPLFGKSESPPPNFGIDEYAAFTESMLEHFGFDAPILIGHSFGGRVGIILAAHNKASKLVLVDAAGLKPKRGLKYHLKVWSYKRAKKKGKALDKYGSEDFKALNDNAKEIFVRIVNRHLDSYVNKIICPTLIVWGKHDKDTPMNMAKKFKHKIRGSGLVVIKGGHYAYAENYQLFNSIIQVFVKE